MPKRSASRITITVALGTSTPTSITVVATSTSSCAGAEPLHHLVLLGGLHPPVEEAETQPAQLVLGEAGERLLGRRHLELLGVLDQRADDVRLAAGGNLGTHGVPRQLPGRAARRR